MTFDDRLAQLRKSLALWLTIQGVERVWLEQSTINVSTLLGETRTSSAGLYSVAEGAEELDWSALRVTGGSLTFSLREPMGSSSLASLMRLRQRRKTWLTSAITKISTTLTVASTTGLIDGQLVYIGGETIKVGVVADATTLTGCTRGMFGSRAQTQEATALLGAAVYIFPTSLKGRRVQLYGSFVTSSGVTDAASTKILATYVIESAVRADERTLVFSCSPIIDEYMAKKCYVGVEETAAAAVSTSALSPGRLSVEVDTAKPFILPASSYPVYALLRGGGVDRGGTVARLLFSDVISSPNRIEIFAEDMLTPSGITPTSVRVATATRPAAYGYASVAAARPIALMIGSTCEWVLRLLCSRLGDGANTSYDVLPGAVRTSLGSTPFRFGAGIDTVDIEQFSFIDNGGPIVVYPLMTTTTVAEIIKEACIAADVFALTLADGRLALRRLGDNIDASVMTLGIDTCTVDPPRIWVDESSVYPHLRWVLNFDPISNESTLVHNTIDAELLQRYPEAEDAFDVVTRGLSVDTGIVTTRQRYAQNRMTLAELDQRARSLQVRGGRGRLLVERRFKAAALLCRIGDVVTIAFTGTNGNGGDINGSSARVVGRRPQHTTGSVILTLEVFDPVFRFAPSSVIVGGGGTTLILSTTSPDSAGVQPEADYYVGQQLALWDVSAGTQQQLIIASISSAPPTLVFTTSVLGVVENGRDWLTWSALSVPDFGTTPNGDDENDWTFGVSDAETIVGGLIRRWC